MAQKYFLNSNAPQSAVWPTRKMYLNL